MKNIIKIGALSLALSAFPVVGAFALTTTQTDTITITVSDNCEVLRQSTAHNNGAGTWSTNTLSATMTNGTVSHNLGKSNFYVRCNNSAGYKVVVTLTDLTHTGTSSLKIPASKTYSASSSGWAPLDGSGSSAPTTNSGAYASGDTVKTESAPTATSNFSVYYGAGISSTQQQGTYTGTATYTLSKL